MNTEIKVCGITNYEDAAAAADLGVRLLGFNLWPKSPRYVSPEQARSIVSRLPQGLTTVGVFVNASRDEILKCVDYAKLTGIQLHGAESLQFVAALHGHLIIKALRVGTLLDPDFEERAVELQKTGATLLFDALVESQPGGTGKEVPVESVNMLAEKGLLRRAFLAGGLTPENVEAKVRQLQPYGVDVASGVEKRAGEKDQLLMRVFIEAVRRGELPSGS